MPKHHMESCGTGIQVSSNIGIKWSTVWMCRICVEGFFSLCWHFHVRVRMMRPLEVGNVKEIVKIRFRTFSNTKHDVHPIFIVFSHFMDFLDIFNSYRGLSALPLLVSMGPARECCVVRLLRPSRSRCFKVKIMVEEKNERTWYGYSLRSGMCMNMPTISWTWALELLRKEFLWLRLACKEEIWVR